MDFSDEEDELDNDGNYCCCCFSDSFSIFCLIFPIYFLLDLQTAGKKRKFTDNDYEKVITHNSYFKVFSVCLFVCLLAVVIQIFCCKFLDLNQEGIFFRTYSKK